MDTAKELIGYFLPAGTLEYFDLTHVVKDKDGLVLFLEEKNTPTAEYAGQTPRDPSIVQNSTYSVLRLFAGFAIAAFIDW